MGQNNPTVRAFFMFMIVLGCSLNIVQVRKLRNGRSLTIEEKPIGVVVKAKQPSSSAENNTNQLVKPDDIVVSDAWDASPIVLESHKLVFFTVPKAG